MITLTAAAPDPLSRTNPSHRPPLRVGLVQHRWRADPKELATVLRDGIDRAAGEGARVVFLPEITLLRYPADTPAGPNPGAAAEDLAGGPTFELAAEAAIANDIFVHASLYEGARGRRRTRLQHRDPGFARRGTGGPHPQAAHPDLGRLLRGHLLPGRTRGRQPVPGVRPRRPGRPHRYADLLGRMVPGGGPQLLARRRRNRRLPNGDRLGAVFPASTRSRCGSR